MSVGLMCFAASEGDSLIAIGDKFPKYSTPIQTKAVQMKPDSSDFFVRWRQSTDVLHR